MRKIMDVSENAIGNIDVTGLASNAFSLIKAIYDQAQLAKGNKKQCQRLGGRCQEIETQIRGMEKLPNTTRFKGALSRLIETL